MKAGRRECLSYLSHDIRGVLLAGALDIVLDEVVLHLVVVGQVGLGQEGPLHLHRCTSFKYWKHFFTILLLIHLDGKPLSCSFQQVL
jgi:hypothetical protein